MKTLIGIQDEFIATVNAGVEKWAHRPKRTWNNWAIGGGHMVRIMKGARHKAEKELVKLGFDEKQIEHIIKDAKEVAELERMTSNG